MNIINLRLTAPQLCDLVGMGFARFESQRRRARNQLELAPEPFPKTPGDDLEPILVKNIETGKWPRYDFEDALMLACTLALEREGMEFKLAGRLVLNSGASQYLAQTTKGDDFWISRWLESSGTAGHFAGSREEAIGGIGADTCSVIALNVSAVARDLVAKAEQLGLAVR